MPIITKNLRHKSIIKSFAFYLALSVFLAGCAPKSDSGQEQDYAKLSQDYYQRAIVHYNDLIKGGRDLDRLYFELGRLYYAHGQFEQAIEALKKSNALQAKKFLVISYYRANNFIDGLETFNKYQIADGEYLYYGGLICEKLNLYDKALELYKKTGGVDFKPKAIQRIEDIEKRSGTKQIKDLAPQVSKILANAPLAEKYPQAGALILSCNERIEITPSATQVSELHYLVKILNERGKEDFGEAKIGYDSTYEKVELEYARTIKPNGEVTEVGSRHIRDVSKYLNFPLYSNARVYIISFPEIAEGASVEYKLKISRNQLINKKDFVINYPVQASEPIISANFDLVLPTDTFLRMKILNGDYNNFGAKLEPQVYKKDNRLVYHWQFKDIPQIIPESNMPPDVQVNPSIIISTFGSWQDIYNWWWGLARDKIKAGAEIKNKVAELIKDQSSAEDKIRAIHNFCAQKIRYVAVEYGAAGYEPHKAEDVFNNKYGDCKDQAILLVTMLKEAGLPGYPVLIGTRENYNLYEDIPSVLFNHCIAAVPLGNKIIFIDPTAETCSFGDLPGGDQERKVLVFKQDGFIIEDTPLYPAAHNMVEQRVSLKINSDESISAEKANFTYGAYDQAQRYWLLYTPPELIKEALNERIQAVSIGAKLNNYLIKNLDNLNLPIVLSYTFQGPEYLTAAGPLRIMPQLSGLDTSLVAKDKRKYPIDFNILDTKETVYEMEIPKNFAVKYLPENVRKENRWIGFTVEYARKENKIFFRQKMELKKKEILEDEYPEFKKFFEDTAKQVKQRIVLEKIKTSIGE